MFHCSHEADGMPDPGPNEHKWYLSEGEVEQGPILVPIKGLVELVAQGSEGDLFFHEDAEDDEAAGAGPCHRGRGERK